MRSPGFLFACPPCPLLFSQDRGLKKKEERNKFERFTFQPTRLMFSCTVDVVQRDISYLHIDPSAVDMLGEMLFRFTHQLLHRLTSSSKSNRRLNHSCDFSGLFPRPNSKVLLRIQRFVSARGSLVRVYLMECSRIVEL